MDVHVQGTLRKRWAHRRSQFTCRCDSRRAAERGKNSRRSIPLTSLVARRAHGACATKAPTHYTSDLIMVFDIHCGFPSTLLNKCLSKTVVYVKSVRSKLGRRWNVTGRYGLASHWQIDWWVKFVMVSHAWRAHLVHNEWRGTCTIKGFNSRYLLKLRSLGVGGTPTRLLHSTLSLSHLTGDS